MISIALPKGRLGEKVYALLARVGYACSEFSPENRKLVFCDERNGVRYFWVKPSDVAIYVALGAADLGVVGKDILTEYNPDVYELLDLNMGKCDMAVAAPKGFTDDMERPLRVATKFTHIARDYYERSNREIQIIKLNGSIELAPILGMSDVIVDIVETGTTLRENNLEVVTKIMPISTRLIANKVAYRFERDRIDRLTKRLEEAL